MAKSERAQWFKMFLHQKALIDSVPNETAGKALKAVFRYFDSQEMDDLDPLAFAVFSAIKPYIDESFSDYQRSVETGRSGGKKRWGKNTHPIAPLNPPIGVSTEAEAEAEADADAKANICRADNPPKRTRFIPPTVDEVRAYCQEHGYQVNPEYFVDYYTANGWMAGKNKMKNWQSAVRNWNRREEEKKSPSKTKREPIPGVRTL